MAKNKNQHYVPVFLLKNFDNGDEKTTNLFIIKHKKFVEKVSISDQASEDYFYGNDKVIEKSLQDLEGLFSQLLDTIITSNVLPTKGSFEHFLLNLFVASSWARTLHSGETINEHIDKTSKVILRHYPKFKDKLDDIKIGIKNPASFALSIAIQNAKYIADLEYKLIKNETDKEYIISDNPVIKHNSFLRSKHWPGGQTGMVAKGIQYFFPLSPKYLITLFDQNCYRVGSRKEKMIILTNDNDVRAINTMQVLNANEVIYFSRNNKLSYIESITKTRKNASKNEKVKVKEYTKVGSTKEKGSSLVVTSIQNLDYDLIVSFIKETKKAKKAVLDNRAIQIRSKRIKNMIKEDRKRDLIN